MYNIYEKLRDAKGVTDYAVAKACNFGKSTFSDWRSGRANPGVKKLQKIADYFNVSLDFLMTGEDKTQNAFGFMSLSDPEQQLVALFRQLNEKGQGKALELVKLLLLDTENKPVKPAKLAVENLAEAR